MTVYLKVVSEMKKMISTDKQLVNRGHIRLPASQHYIDLAVTDITIPLTVSIDRKHQLTWIPKHRASF